MPQTMPPDNLTSRRFRIKDAAGGDRGDDSCDVNHTQILGRPSPPRRSPNVYCRRIVIAFDSSRTDRRSLLRCVPIALPDRMASVIDTNLEGSFFRLDAAIVERRPLLKLWRAGIALLAVLEGSSRLFAHRLDRGPLTEAAVNEPPSTGDSGNDESPSSNFTFSSAIRETRRRSALLSYRSPFRYRMWRCSL